MARNSGHRYRLVLYTYTLNRWWKLLLWIGILMLIMAAGLSLLPLFFPLAHFPIYPDAKIGIVAGAGGFTVLLAIFFITIRKSAYIQPFKSYLRLATPLLRLNISYKRIRQASSTEMQRLFPLERYKGWRRKFLRPLGGQTAIVLEMNGWPLSRWALNLFLSPFFFPDKSPRMALLIQGWMDFSTEMESFRGAWLQSQREAERAPQYVVLKRLSKRRR
jgi:hypothetical protein